jgi:acyl-CoA-binding protein
MNEDTEKEFQQALRDVQRLASKPADKELLDLYALYKQASEGDVSGKRPGMLDIRGRYKFDAWAAKKGMARNTAMKAYVELVRALQARLGTQS